MINHIKKHLDYIVIIIISGFISLYITCLINERTLTTNLQRSFIYVYFFVIIVIALHVLAKKFTLIIKKNKVKKLLGGLILISLGGCLITSNYFLPRVCKANDVTINILADKNHDSQGQETWITGIKVNGVSQNIANYANNDTGWSYKENSLYGNAADSGQLNLKLSKAKKIELSFVKHKWSGNIEIKNGDFTQIYDLYDEEGSTLITQIPTLQEDYRGWIRLFLICGLFFIYLLILYLFIYLYWKLKKSGMYYCKNRDSASKHKTLRTKNSNGDKIEYLEGLRAICALIVLFNHFTALFFPKIFNDITLRTAPIYFLINGENAVIIFFCISSYLLGYKYFKHPNISMFISTIFKRYFRLILPCLFSIILSYILIRNSLMYANILNNEYIIWEFPPNLKDALYEGIIGIFTGKSTNYNVALWTIKYEITGPLLAITILSIFGLYKKRGIVYGICLIYFRYSYFSAFIIGVIISDIVINHKYLYEKLSAIYVNILLFVIGFILSMYPVTINTSDELFSIMQKISGYQPIFWRIIGSSILFLFVINSKCFQKILSLKFLTHIGKLSFSIYVIHLAILGSFSSWLYLNLIKVIPYILSVLVTLICSMLVIYLVSLLIYKYIDTNGIKLSNLIYTKYFKT